MTGLRLEIVGVPVVGRSGCGVVVVAVNYSITLRSDIMIHQPYLITWYVLSESKVQYAYQVPSYEYYTLIQQIINKPK